MTLTERRQIQTRNEIADAASKLFATRGFAATTMEDVAVAAGVSRRTVYRHFAQKHELPFNETLLWLERYDEVVASREAGESARSIVRRALLEVAELIEERRDRVLAAWAVVQSDPSMNAYVQRTQSTWLERHFSLIADAVGTEPDDLLRASVLAGALVAATNALVAVWAQQPGADMPQMTETALDYIDPLWPNAAL